ncbi:glycosyltransferase [Labilibaculum euxinus]
MKKIVHVIFSLRVAGAENVCVTICNHLNKEKYKVYIITIFDAVPLAEKLKNNTSVTVISMGVPLNSRFWLFSPKVFIKFRRILKEIAPDTIHSHFWGVGTWILSVIKDLPIKNRIATIHTSGGHYKSSYWFSRIDRNVEMLTYKLLNFKLVCVSEEVRKTMKEKLKLSNSSVILNGIDIDYFIPVNGNAEKSTNYPVLIHVGRFLPAKNHWDIIRSLPVLKKKFPNFRMYFLGVGVKEQLEEYCKENHLIDNVYFHGVQDNVLKYLHQADIGIFPSSYEGLGLALLEMMSCELPVIISDIPVFREITKNGTCAKIVGLHQIEELSNCIVELAGDKKQMSDLGKTGRKIVMEKFSHKQMISSYEAMYDMIY